MSLDPIHISAIIGVIGTLAGVILGSVLNRIERRGKIKIFQNSLNIKLNERDPSTGGANATKEVTDNTDYLLIKLNFDFYNTSALSPKIAREIKVLIKAKTGIIKDKLKNEKTRQYTKYFSHADDLLNLNLAPKEIKNFTLTYSSRDKFQEILDSDWYIEYRDDSNRIRRIKIDKKLSE